MGAAGSDFNVMQEAGRAREKEERSGKEEVVEGADGGFGPREDASKEHLSQRAAGRLITEGAPGFVYVCVRVLKG